MSAANAPKSPVTKSTSSNLPPWLDDTPTGGSWTTVEPPPRLRDDVPPGQFNHVSTAYRPTSEQLARDEARRRYLTRSVYAPILVAVLVLSTALLAIILLAFGVNTPAARSLIAGLSALTVILFSIPVIALMSILPLAWLGWRFNRRQHRQQFPEYGPMAYRSRVQTLLWQLDSLLDRIGSAVVRGSARLTQPLITLHARADYWQELARGVRRNFTRSK